VAFIGVHATTWDIHDDMLRMFEGKRLVDSARVTGGSGLQLWQSNAGVILSESSGGPIGFGSGPLALIPQQIGSA
jgi:hypothetical protein